MYNLHCDCWRGVGEIVNNNSHLGCPPRLCLRCPGEVLVQAPGGLLAAEVPPHPPRAPAQAGGHPRTGHQDMMITLLLTHIQTRRLSQSRARDVTAPLYWGSSGRKSRLSVQICNVVMARPGLGNPSTLQLAETEAATRRCTDHYSADISRESKPPLPGLPHILRCGPGKWIYWSMLKSLITQMKC